MNDFEKRLVELEEQFQWHDHDGVNSKKFWQTSWAMANLFGTSAATAGNYSIFFTATRPCIVKRISEVHTTAGTDGSAVTLQVERLQGTEAPDSGDVLLQTAFDLKGTANTVQEGTTVTTTVLALAVGDRLCLKDSGVLTSVAGVNVTVELTYT